MANYLEKIIEDIKGLNGGEEDELVIAIRERAAKLGSDPTEDEVREILQACIAEQMEKLASGLTSENRAPENREEEVDAAFMASAIEVVEDFLDENDWHYNANSRRPDIYVFELGFTVRGVNLRVKIYVEDNPKVCRIEAILPFNADATYEYPLCALLVKESYQKRFGAFKYDERDGELTYEYSFRIGNSFHKDDLDTYFHAVASSAAGSFDAIRKCCVGRFKTSEVNDILQKVNKLVDDISE